MSVPDQLEIISPDGSVQFYSLDPVKGITNIGRHPDNDIIIESPNVVLFHAVLDHRRKPYQVVVLSEEGETYVDGNPVSPNVSTALGNEGMLELDGHTLILMETTSAPAREAGPETPVQEMVSEDEPQAPQVAPLTGRADEYILLEMEEREAAIEVEQTATFTLTIVNGGPIVANFVVGVQGATEHWDPSWVDVAPATVNLNEGERALVTVFVTPPREPSSRAGSHPFSIVVSSPDYPGRYAEIGATLTINPYYEFAVGELSPKQQTVGGRKPSGEAIFHVANKGNSEAHFRVDGMDDRRACNFEFKVPGEKTSLAQQAEMRLPPEKTFVIPVRITPTRAPLIGWRGRNHPFTVTTTMTEGQTPRSLLGQLRVKPLIGPLWILLIFLSVLVLGMLIFDPRIYEFRVEPAIIEAGEPVTLHWRGSRLASLSVTTGSGGATLLESPEGQMELLPEDRLYPDVDQTYTLIANNWLSNLIGLFRDEESSDVTVNPVEPVIRVFSVDSNTIIRGESFTLRWEVINAEDVTLSVNGSEETLRSMEYTGERTVSPMQAELYVYELHATNRYGTVSAEPIEVVVLKPTPTPLPRPTIEDFSVTPLMVTEGQTVTLRWEVEGASLIRLSSSNTGWTQEYESLIGTEIHQPPATTNFVLTAINAEENASESAESTITVIVSPKPSPTPEPEVPSVEFSIVPEEVTRGDGTTPQLVWTVTGETTDIEISGPTLGTVNNLSARGSLPVSADTTSFFILTAYNGDVSTSQTVVLNVLEPPPPTPTPLPVPDILVFEAQWVADPGDILSEEVVSLEPLVTRYQIVAGAPIGLNWSVEYVSIVTLYRNGDSLGNKSPAGSLPARIVTQTLEYELVAINADDVSAHAFVEIIPVLPGGRPAPENVDGPIGPSNPLTVTWNYDDDFRPYILGFRVYRAPPPHAPGDFVVVADYGDLNRDATYWVDESPLCDQAYYVTAVYRDQYGAIQETDPSAERYFSWSCVR